MTNREMLIHDLSLHDGDADLSVADYIECPYYRDEDCKNSGKNLAVGSFPYEENCRCCKAEWLEKEWEE